jgi:hypothetical protein
MRLDAQKNYIDGACFLQIANHFGLGEKIVVGADDPHSVLLHGAEVRATSM